MKKVAVMLDDGFEEIEALTVVDIIRRANITCDMFSVSSMEVKGAHDIVVKADKLISEEVKEYDVIVLPGGMPGATNLRDNEEVIDLVKWFNDNKKIVAAICAAPIVLGKAGIIEGKKVTSYPGFEDELVKGSYLEEHVVVDGNIITSRGPATAMLFAYKILELLQCDKWENIRVLRAEITSIIEMNTTSDE
mgnify:CR=1 FL=1